MIVLLTKAAILGLVLVIMMIFFATPLNNSFVFKEITGEEIIHITKGMSSNKAVGHDEIFVNILKANIDVKGTIKKIFNLSFFSGVFPDELKVDRVLPTYKGDDPNLVQNYRPITILSAIDLLFEKLIASGLIEFIEKYQILASQRHGFRKIYSTNTAVHSVTKIINQALH